MLNRDNLFDAMSGVRDEYLSFAANLLGYQQEETDMHLEQKAKRTGLRKTGRILLIAAVIACLFTVTAFAAGLFSVSTRVPDPKETFQIHWDDSENGYLEWSDAKLVLTFPEVAESREIEVRPRWLPFEMPSRLAGSLPWSNLSSETWFQRFASESLCFPDEAGNPPQYSDISQPILIQLYSMAQFRDDGALLMLYQTPGEIKEEHWNDLNVDVLSFHGRQHFDERYIDWMDKTMEAYDIDYDYVLLSNAEAGWVIEVCGQLGMDTVRKVAENLEVRETGNTLTPDDFENRFVFIDGGVG